MRHGLKLMVLAGSAEARTLAQAAQAGGAQVRALVSEPPRGPNPMPVPCDLHGFADEASVIAACTGVDAVLDASHGFDAVMSEMGFAAARALGIPFLSYARPSWPQVPDRKVIAMPDVVTAVSGLGPTSRVFSATGWASLPDYAGFKGAKVLLRQTSLHDRRPPFDFIEPVFGIAPFTTASEVALFKELSIDTLICRNLGGQASRPKVEAAMALGIETLLINPPALPEGAQIVHDTDAARAWIAAL